MNARLNDDDSITAVQITGFFFPLIAIHLGALTSGARAIPSSGIAEDYLIG